MAKRRQLRLVGLQEAAALAGITTKTLHAYIARGQANVPAPDAVLACGPVWRAERIEAWVAVRQS